MSNIKVIKLVMRAMIFMIELSVLVCNVKYIVLKVK